ncbi:ribosomal protein l22e [Phaffia rhodozyma]|uniref:Large ribosomal subunit protein eL22 n=1 Tax=Phaffia rhodozyma TaxID=264483 RepID=A0A0F7SIC1_PHARH|nr:ribosomal protein l22e [Phaffia rhodozyma]
MPKVVKPTGPSKKAQSFTIDCTKPAEDRIFDVAGFEKYLHDNIKIDGKPGQLGSVVGIERVEDTKIVITSTTALSKRYLKFLTKRYLKKSTLRDFVRVVASGKDSYQLRFFNIQGEDGEEVEGEDEEDME